MENDFLISLMGFGEKYPKLHIPGKYNDSEKHEGFRHKSSNKIQTVSIEQIAKPYRNVSKFIIGELYKNYYA